MSDRLPDRVARRRSAKEGGVYASVIDMTLRLPVDEALFEELRTDFLPKASRHPGFLGFQYVLGGQGHAIGILWYRHPKDLDDITEVVGSWFRDHISPRLAEPETAMQGRVIVDAGDAPGEHRRT